MLKEKKKYSLTQIVEKYFFLHKTHNQPDPFPSKKSALLSWAIFTFLVLTLFYFFYINTKINKIDQSRNGFQESMAHIKKGALISTPLLGGLPLPSHLSNIPFAETNGSILNVKRVHIRGIQAPYNPSLLKYNSGYLLFFRYDVPHSDAAPAPFFSFVGIAELDQNFEQTSKEFQQLDLKSNFAEDPRAVLVENQLYISYNDRQPHDPNCRSIHVANVDLNTFTVNYTTRLDLHLQHIEKNWTPFAYSDINGQSNLHFEYYISPRKVFKLPNPTVNDLQYVPSESPSPSSFYPWSTHFWGNPRGGTGAIKTGDEYLSFFHSSFKYNKDVMWYVMGAYTFEAHPPFRITSVSHYPILFKDIYDTPPSCGANPNVRCIFPCGQIIEERAGKEVIHLACGENDSAVKIITLDKQALMDTMKTNKRPFTTQ